jgi:NAD(P)-dependent dehydrogenase (short-subunit alcohol dehydrogenase family)
MLRTVVITGVAEGLGRTLAERFAALGDRVFGCDAVTTNFDALRRRCPGLELIEADVSRVDHADAFFARIAGSGCHVDVLVNNVGVAGPRAYAEEISVDAWNACIQANLNGAFWFIQRVLPGMKARRCGAIVNVSTASVRTLPPCRAPYVVSKAALEGLTRAIAREAGIFDVRCNAVQPGLMDNERLARVIARVAEQSGRSIASIEEEALSHVSMRSKVQMSEVAAMIEFLCSDAAKHVTGQIIAVDAGVEWEA